MADWDRAIGEADELASLEDAARCELAMLWGDLGGAMRMAYKGRWSIGCDNLVARIVQLSRAAGTWTPWEEIEYPMLLDGTWHGITAAAGVTVPVPGEDDLQRAREWMDSQRLAARASREGERHG